MNERAVMLLFAAGRLRAAGSSFLSAGYPDNFGVLDPAGIDDHVVRREPVDDPIRAVEEGVAVVDGRRRLCDLDTSQQEMARRAETCQRPDSPLSII